jgi:hypothetical protein
MKFQEEIGYRGAGNLSRSDMKHVRVMTDDEVVDVLKMLALGATHVNFQESVLYFSITLFLLQKFKLKRHRFHMMVFMKAMLTGQLTWI